MDKEEPDVTEAAQIDNASNSLKEIKLTGVIYILFYNAL